LYNTRPAGLGYSLELPTFDVETYSEAGYFWDVMRGRWRGVTPTSPGLAAVGAPAYAAHASTRLRSLAYDLRDGSGPQLWVPALDGTRGRQPNPLLEHVAAGRPLEAHNALFEFYIWNLCARRLYGWPELRLEQLYCSMAKCRAWALPGALGKAGPALGLDIVKDKTGEQILGKVSKPRSPSKSNPFCSLEPDRDPAVFEQLYQYNIQDIRAEAALSAAVPDLTEYERAVWQLDARINTRGVYIDRESLAACADIIAQANEVYNAELRELTGGAVQAATERDKLLVWLNGNGCRMVTVDADAVASAMADPTVPPAARRALEIRDTLASASVRKLGAIERQLSPDGRLRDLFSYCGADRTGRWAGRGPQPQNIPGGGPALIRCSCGYTFAPSCPSCPSCGVVDGEPISWGYEAAEQALAVIGGRRLEQVEAVYGNAVAAVSGCLRGLFCAAPGCELVCSDFSAIEAVVLAQLAGEAWRLEVFKTHGKIYERTAADITGISFDEILAHREQTGEHHKARKLGKLAELASGYQGWLGAWRAFGADEFLDDPDIKAAILAWRAASPAIVHFWGGQYQGDRYEPYGLEGAAICAVRDPGRSYAYRDISYCCYEGVLYCRLPSGRYLNYHAPEVTETVDRYRQRPCYRLSYMGYNTDPRRGAPGWTRLESYGGKLAENAIQGTSRDLLADAMLRAEAAGYPVVLHVHDEIVTEVPEGWGSVSEFEQLLQTMPSWAQGWPVKAAGGWRGRRYRKD